MAENQQDPTVPSEFAVPPPGDPAWTREIAPPRVDFRLEASFSGFVLTDDDMSDAYSSIPLVRAGLTMDLGPEVQFLISAGYGARTADMEIGDPTFEGESELKLKLIPFQMGFRLNTTRLETFRINLGAFLQAVWMKETAPYFQDYPYFDAGISGETGWGKQIQISLGPEWRFADQKWVIGAEAMAAGGGGNVGDLHERDISLEGFSGRVYCSLKLGTIQEEPRALEVQP